MTRSFVFEGKTYTVYPEGVIECDWPQCGEWHQYHNLYDLLEEVESPVIELVKDNK